MFNVLFSFKVQYLVNKKKNIQNKYFRIIVGYSDSTIYIYTFLIKIMEQILHHVFGFSLHKIITMFDSLATKDYFIYINH